MPQAPQRDTVLQRLISLSMSLLILAILYWKIDGRGLLQVLQTCNSLWLILSLGMVIPITLITSWRLQQLLPTPARAPSHNPAPRPVLGFGEANRLILVASVLNMVLPSKMGDIAKAYFMRERGHLSGTLSLSLVIFEKACDMLSLLLWCAFGLLRYPRKDWLFGVMTVSVLGGLISGSLLLGSRAFARFFFTRGQALAPTRLRAKLAALQASWHEMHAYFWHDPKQFCKVTATSVCLWFLHLLQIWLFILALNAWAPFVANLALSPLALLAGLLPLTFAGIGTRDAALVFFCQPFFDAQTAAALGVLCTSRYILPALAGLPFLRQYLATIRRLRRLPADKPVA
jgi:uncharacterized protein (TIRG00374 family)